MLRIRLSRVGKKKQPAYRIIVADSRSPRDGSFLKIIGHYNPLTDPATLVVKEDEAVHWLEKGAKPSDTAAKLLTRIGVMERAGRQPVRYEGKVVPPAPKKEAKAAATSTVAAEPKAAEAKAAPAEAESPPEAEAVAATEGPEAAEAETPEAAATQAEAEAPEGAEEAPEIEAAEPEADAEAGAEEQPEATTETKEAETETEPKATNEEQNQEQAENQE